jgi:hypothetical protein
VLVWASTYGLRRLWGIAVATAVAACLANIVVPDIDLASAVCGPLCGAGWNFSPFGIAVSSVVTGTVLSAPAIQRRRMACIVVGWVVATVSLVPAVTFWIS